MTLTIATWNINSVRLRIRQVGHFLDRYQPDILCLQEIKCPDDRFPVKPFKRRGYEHILVNGQKGYHGVAIVSRVPFAATDKRGFCDKGDARHACVTHRRRRRRHPPPQLLHPGRRRRAGPGDQREIRAQARLPRRDARLADGRRDRPEGDPRRRPQHRAARDRRVVAQAAPARRQPHPGRDRALRGRARRGRLGRRGAAFRAEGREALHVVELSRRRLGGRRQGPPARPYLGDAAPRRDGSTAPR